MIGELAARARRPEVAEGVGGFSGLFRIGEGRLLAAATDGVGTKTEIARELGRLDTIGIDLVAMCADDVVCTGAEPLFFLDYLAVGKVIPERVASIVGGVGGGLPQGGVRAAGRRDRRASRRDARGRLRSGRVLRGRRRRSRPAGAGPGAGGRTCSSACPRAGCRPTDTHSYVACSPVAIWVSTTPSWGGRWGRSCWSPARSSRRRCWGCIGRVGSTRLRTSRVAVWSRTSPASCRRGSARGSSGGPGGSTRSSTGSSARAGRTTTTCSPPTTWGWGWSSWCRAQDAPAVLETTYGATVIGRVVEGSGAEIV